MEHNDETLSRAAGAFALVVGLAIGQDRGRQDDRRKDRRVSPAAAAGSEAQSVRPGRTFPGQPDKKGSPFAPLGFSGRLSPAAARRIIPQYEEELELTEAQRDIRPNINYAQMAKAYGMYSEGPIENPNDLAGAYQRALAKVRAGEPALIDVISQPR